MGSRAVADASSDDRAAFFGRAASVSFANVDSLFSFYATEAVSISDYWPRGLRRTSELSFTLYLLFASALLLLSIARTCVQLDHRALRVCRCGCLDCLALHGTHADV